MEQRVPIYRNSDLVLGKELEDDEEYQQAVKESLQYLEDEGIPNEDSSPEPCSDMKKKESNIELMLNVSK